MLVAMSLCECALGLLLYPCVSFCYGCYVSVWMCAMIVVISLFKCLLLPLLCLCAHLE